MPSRSRRHFIALTATTSTSTMPVVPRRRGSSTALLLTSLLAAAWPAHAATPAKAPPPNVIFFATDDLNDWVGPLNSPIRAKTPNLDRLAARGVTFQNAQASVNATVSAIDLFPTLVELCRLAPDAGLEGQSLAATLRQPALARDRNVLLCEVNPGGYAIVNQRWRYIHYADGTEELYDVVQDPNEWDNLAPQEKYRTVMADLRQSAPKRFAPPGPESKDLRLVTAGERFHWELKPAGAKKRNAAEPLVLFAACSDEDRTQPERCTEM